MKVKRMITLTEYDDGTWAATSTKFPPSVNVPREADYKATAEEALHSVTGAQDEIAEAEHALAEANAKHGATSQEWAEAHAHLEELVHRIAGIPWHREQHFVSEYDRTEP